MTAVLALLFLQSGGDLPRKVPLCELFSAPLSWHGKLIEIEGPVSTSTEGGPWVDGPDCPAQIVVKGERFPNSILLTAPDPAWTDLPIPFPANTESSRRFWHALAQVDRKRDRLVVRAVGLFETRVPLDDLIRRDRPFPDNGFGHMGGAPAQLIVKEVTVVRTERIPQRRGQRE